MIRFMRHIYRRWLIQYRWANILARIVNRVCFDCYRMVGYLKFRVFGHWLAHDLLNGVSELEPASNQHPSAELWLLKDVRVIGHSRFLLKEKKAVYDSAHPNFHIRDIYTAYYFLEESQGLMLYHSRKASCYFHDLKLQTRLNGTWLSIMSGASRNWMHWLAESIPRLAGALAVIEHGKFGLLVDQELPKNMREVLDIFASDIPRFEVRQRHFVEVEQLIVPTMHAGMCLAWPRPSHFKTSTTHLDHMRAFRKSGIYHFDTDALALTRKKILEHFGLRPHKAKKLFVLRKSRFRHMTNQEHIEKLLSARGFESVSPGELSVEAQVKLFSEAAVVVAQGGAALANIMFAPEGCAVICIAVHNEYVNFGYFSDYAKIFGVTVDYVFGDIDASDKYNANHIGDISHPMNADFCCAENKLLEKLDDLRGFTESTHVIK